MFTSKVVLGYRGTDSTAHYCGTVKMCGFVLPVYLDWPLSRLFRSSRCGLRTTIKEFLKIHTQSHTLSLLNFLFGSVRIRFSDSKDVSWFIWLMVLPKDDRVTFHLYLQKKKNLYLQGFVVSFGHDMVRKLTITVLLT